MTRSSLNRRLHMIYALCFLILAVTFLSALAKHAPGLVGKTFLAIASDVYAYMRDMALVFVTMFAAYLANVFQKRTKFVASLEEEWRAMVKTKTRLMRFCETADTTIDDYLHAYGRISATLDNMRIVYRNVGETRELIGLYPYSPLHDMRRALETLDPRRPAGPPSADQRQVVCAAIQQSFTALRETFLEELDLEEPTHGQLVSGAGRVKHPGATRSAYTRQKMQQKRWAAPTSGSTNEAVKILLAEAYEREQTGKAASRKK